MVSRLIDLPFTRGIDESTDETVLAPPGMTELVNYRLTRAGRLEHRLGVVAPPLEQATAGASPVLSPDGSWAQGIYQRFLASGGHGYTCLGSGTWACVGSLSRFVPVDSYQGLPSNYDETGTCTSVNGFLVVVGHTSANSFTGYSVFDERTGTLILKGGLLGSYPRVVASGDRAIIVTQNQATGAILASSIDFSSAPYQEAPLAVSVVAAAAASGFDAAPYSDTEFLISYRSGTTAQVALVTSATLVVADSGGASGGAGELLTTCIGTPGEGVYLAWRNLTSNEVRYAFFDTSLSQVGSTQTIATITPTFLSAQPRPVLCRTSATAAIVGWTDSYEAFPFATYRSTFRVITSTPSLGATYGPTYGTFIASKPFISADPFYGFSSQPAIWLGNYNPTATELDRSVFLMLIGEFSGSTDNAASTVELSASASRSPLVDTLIGSLFQVSDVVESTSDGPKAWQCVFTEVFRGAGTSTPETTVQVYRFADSSRSIRARTRAIVPCQGGLAVLGGVPRYYDTDQLIEIGMMHGPTVIEATPAVTGSMGVGTYQYVFLLEYIDGRGQRHLSYPSSPISVTLAGAEAQVNFDVLASSLWGFPNTGTTSNVLDRRVTLRAYRTSNNGTVFRYSPDTNAPVYGGPLKAFSQIVYQDVNSDADIAANEALYVQVGNAVSNYRAPPCRFGCEHEGRLVVAGSWNPSEYIVSKTFFVGEGIQFTESPSFRDVCPEPITGMASLDGSLVLFSERSIHTVTGDGPADDGSGTFSKPRRLPGRIGCVDWRSILTTEAGIYFRAADGIYLLPRGLASPQFVGAPVKNKLRMYPETLGSASITRAMSPDVEDHDSEQVLTWLVGDQEDPTVPRLFNYSPATGTWSESHYGPEKVLICAGPWLDIENQTEVLGVAKEVITSATTGTFLVESPGLGYDRDISDSYTPVINGEWRTGKIFPFGFGGRGSIRSIRLVGECLAATTLTPYIYSDAEPSGYAGSVLTFTAGRFAVEIPFRHKDIAWIQVGAVDPVTGGGAGLRFNGLALEVEMEPGLIRSTPGNRSI